MTSYKVNILGSSGVGKSSLWNTFEQGTFYYNALKLSSSKTIEFDGSVYKLEHLDVQGTTQFTAFRDLYIKNAKGFIIIYSIIAQSTFNDLPDIREQILRVKDKDSVPLILVGAKCDLTDQRVITYEQGELLAKKFGNCAFYEVSAKEGINVETIFHDLIRQMDEEYKSKEELLYNAIKSGNLNKVKELFPTVVKSLNANKYYYKGESIFIHACNNEQYEIIKYFIEETNTNIDYTDKSGISAIHYCSINNKLKVISYLLDLGANPICKGGKNLLQWAFENKKYGLVVLLLKRKDNDYINTTHIKEKMINEARKLSPIRITILGAPASGKTTLTRLIERKLNKISGFPDENIATDGIAVSNIGEYSFWDFGGQELLYSTHQFFLSEETQYILVVDLSLLIHSNENKRKQCEKDTCYWINLIKDWTISHTSPPVIIVGTHCDLLKQTKKIKEIDNAINKLLYIIKDNNLRTNKTIYQISKKSKSQKGIKNLYITIKKQTNEYIAKKRGFITGSENNLNLQYTALRLLIENERETKQFIWWNEFIKLCNSVEIYNNNEISNVSKFLVNFGSILTYRHQSTSGVSLVVLDPEWLAKSFTSIISVRFLSSSLRRGFFTRENLENHWIKLNINKSTWPQLEKLFEMFNLLVKLPNNEYFVPIMLHSHKLSKSMNNEERLKYINDKITNTIFSYGRIIKFSKLPFGLIDRLVVRLLHYPNMNIDTHITISDDYFLYTDTYFIRIYSNYNNDEVYIHLYIVKKQKDLSFFAHFLFESPQSLLSSYVSLNASIISSKVLYNSNDIGEEKHIITEILQGKYYGNESPDLGLEGIERLDVSEAKIIKRLAAGTFGIAWLGNLNDGKQVVFKELIGVSLNHQKEFLREVLMMKLLDYKYLVKLLGISNISNSLIESSKKISQGDNPIKSKGLLMILEFAQYGDLSTCRLQLQKASNILKSKIALDIGIGLRDLHDSSGLPMIHRDVRSQNIFIFSLDETDALDKNSIHAKLADFGTVVVASPNYGEILGNWQYMAPEAFQGALTVPYTSKIDVYSFGILLWEIFTNEIPYEEYLEPGRAEEGRNNILKGERPIIPNTLIQNLSLLIKQCWETNPEKRGSFNEIVSQLEEIYKYYINESYK